MNEWRQYWAREVRGQARFSVAVNAALTAQGLETGVVWPLLTWFKPRIDLRPNATCVCLTVQGYSLGVPPCLQKLTQLPTDPELLVGRATRDRIPSLRPCMRPAGNLWAVDLLTTPEVGKPGEIATLILEYREARFSTFPGLPTPSSSSLVKP